jgi:hypothetical protein
LLLGCTTNSNTTDATTITHAAMASAKTIKLRRETGSRTSTSPDDTAVPLATPPLSVARAVPVPRRNCPEQGGRVGRCVIETMTGRPNVER